MTLEWKFILTLCLTIPGKAVLGTEIQKKLTLITIKLPNLRLCAAWTTALIILLIMVMLVLTGKLPAAETTCSAIILLSASLFWIPLLTGLTKWALTATALTLRLFWDAKDLALGHTIKMLRRLKTLSLWDKKKMRK